MPPLRHPRVLPASLAIASLLAAACSSGGGDDGIDGFAGRISVLSPTGAVLEIEPNDGFAQAQALGALDVGETITVAGSVTNAGPDVLDAFQVDPAQPLDLTVSLAHGASPIDLDFEVFDAGTMNPIAAAQTGNNPDEASFSVSAPFQVHVSSFLGDGGYTLTIGPQTPAPEAAAGAPDDARFLGSLYPDDSRTIAGGPGNAVDVRRFLLALPYDAHLDVRVLEPGAGGVEVVLRDVTLSRSRPVELVRVVADGPGPLPRTWLPSLSLLELELRDLDAAGAWALEVAAVAPAVVQPRGRIAPLDAARELSPRARPLALFGEVPARCAPGEVLLLPRPGADVARELELAGARELARIPGDAWRVGFDLAPGLSDEERQRITLAVAQTLAARAAFEYAEPNWIVQAQGEPDDPFYQFQWHYPQLQLPAAWDLTTGDDSVVVAILDTGQLSHPDLNARTIPGYDLISDPANAGDGDGPDPDPTDEGDGDGFLKPNSYHGTHVAGTVAADTDNGTGVAGVTWLGKVQHVRVLGKSGGTNFDIANGIRWAAGLSVSGVPLNGTPAKVLNLSLGGPGNSTTTQNAVTAARNAGAVIVAAAGNNNSSTPFYPASHAGVVSVSAVDFKAAKAPYSNFNPMVDVAAPGGDVGKDLNGDGYPDGVLSTLYDDAASQPNYVFYQGTSMASPHVAGVVALMRALDPLNLKTPADFESALFTTTTDLGAVGKDNVFGHGLVNAYQALLAIQGGPPPPPMLSLSTGSVALSKSQKKLKVQVANVGGGLLTVFDPTVTVSTPLGGTWLSAVRVPVASPTSTDTSAIEVRADLTALDPDSYVGSVQVDSNGGSQTIQVLLTVTGGATLDVDLYVLAVDVDTFETVAQAVVNPTSGLAWEMPDLPAGDYLVVAGSDDDGDLFICGPGDLYCGFYPTLDDPGIVTKVEGQTLGNLDFAVSSAFQGAGGAPHAGFARLE